MLKKCNIILNLIIGSSVGVFLGHLIYSFVEYKKQTVLYELQSAPWYTSSIVYGLVTIVVVLIAITTKIFLSARIKQKMIDKKSD